MGKTPVRPHACIGCTDWQDWTEENGMNQAEQIINRMMQATGSTSKNKLASIVGGNLYQAAELDRIPPRWFEILQDKHGINPEWLKTGTGEPKMAATHEAEPEAEITTRSMPEPPAASCAATCEEDRAKGLAMDSEPLMPDVGVTYMPDIPTEELIEELMGRIPGITIIIRGNAA
jgi:hypothetical protein